MFRLMLCISDTVPRVPGICRPVGCSPCRPRPSQAGSTPRSPPTSPITHAARRVLRRSSQRTREVTGDRAMMQVSPSQGALLTLLTRVAGAKRALEIGTFTGYSSICIARGLVEGGYLMCCDVSEEYASIARQAWADAGVDDRIELRDRAGAWRRSPPFPPRPSSTWCSSTPTRRTTSTTSRQVLPHLRTRRADDRRQHALVGRGGRRERRAWLCGGHRSASSMTPSQPTIGSTASSCPSPTDSP